jgi:deoxyribose-phosphate aldolase
MHDSASFTQEGIRAQLGRIHSQESIDMTPENLRLIFSLIDLTSLNTGDNPAGIKSICQKLNGFKDRFPDVPNVAAICVYPSLVQVVKENLSVPSVSIASVAAGFPSSQTFPEIKDLESRLAVRAGADEIDIVISLGKFLEDDLEFVSTEISRIKGVIHPARLKVILESGLIPEPEDLYRVSRACLAAGADYIKTSTGKVQPAATPEAVLVMCHAIRDHHKETGRKAGIKPAGGIGTAEQALVYAEIVRSVLGVSWLSPEKFRIGASRLANHILTSVTRIETGSTEGVEYF